MVHVRHSTPAGHGEVLTEPDYGSWASRMDANAEAVSSWDLEIAGMSAWSFRRQARRETLAQAGAYSRRMGLEPAEQVVEPRHLVVTGHQPELYHPGVWVKDFLLQRLADESEAAALDLVVDTDAFEQVALATPCMRPEVGRCEVVLTKGDTSSSYVNAPVPLLADVQAFRSAGGEALQTLPAPALGRHFSAFCDALEESLDHADDLAQALTGARRRFEKPAETDYLELGVSRQARTRSFLLFAASVMMDARRFAQVFNDELSSFRAMTGTRSKVQPFPDLGVTDASVELPFWVLRAGERAPAWIAEREDGLSLYAGEDKVLELRGSVEDIADALGSTDALLAPRAVTLTLFNRLFVADLFVHGVGGGRYDRVTDGVIRAYYGVEPPSYVIASMTLHLPLGGHEVTAEEVSALEQRLQRLEHNPDQLLGEVEFEDADERAEAEALVAEKCRLVTDIAVDGADKKAIGERIRAVNARLGEMMAPITAETRERLQALHDQRSIQEVLSDRTYPYCLWNPIEVMDKVR